MIATARFLPVGGSVRAVARDATKGQGGVLLPRLGRPPSFRGHGTMARLLARRSKGVQGRSRESRPTNLAAPAIGPTGRIYLRESIPSIRSTFAYLCVTLREGLDSLMFWAIFVVLLIFWAIGLICHIAFSNLLLVIAVIALIIRLVRSRTP
jgi:Family of unknown function (DUF5670)